MHPKNKIEKDILLLLINISVKKILINFLRNIHWINEKGRAKIFLKKKKGRIEVTMILKQGKKNEIEEFLNF